MRALAFALGVLLCGRAVAADPARVVAVGGAVTEIVYALGAQGRLVGADSTSTHPEAAKALPRVGYMRQLSAEGVLSLRPDLVLVTTDAGPPEALAQIERAGVRVVRLPVQHSMESLLANVGTVAGAMGLEAQGASLVKALQGKWQAFRATAGQGGRPARVLFVLSHGGGAPLVSGRDTAADAMITLAGAVNAMSSFQGYRPLTPESAIAAAPDVILVTREGLEAVGGKARLLGLGGLSMTPAGKSGRVVALDALYLLGFGPRLPDAVAELSSKLATP